MNSDTLEAGIILHELSNIGMVIQAGAQVLASAQPGSRDARTGTDTIAHGARRLNETLAALRVLLGKSGEIADHSPHSLLDFVRDFAGDSAAWKGRNRSIRVSADRIDPEIIVPDLLRLILRNFIANALDYSPAGSPIDVRIRHAGKETRILVRNRGPKIADEVRSCLFEPGCKGPKGGSGIGLHISQRAARALNGRIRYLSHRRQTAFVVIFPTRRVGNQSSGVIAA